MINHTEIQAYRDLMSGLDSNGRPEAVILKEPRAVRADAGSRCLVLDAAFNPPTMAHWELAMTGALASSADRILVQLSSANVDKSVSGADLGQRLYMLKHLTSEDDRVGVSACSHARFVDKASALSRISRNTQFIFAIGYDTLERLFDPKYYSDFDRELETLFGMAEFVVANRGENDAKVLRKYLREQPANKFHDKIHQTTLSQQFTDMSSSKTRILIETGMPFTHCVPKGIPELITEMELYKK
jgi:nicotinic acid mononucleotide adenylyltransferase